MKKVIALLLTLLMAVSFCVPAFASDAENPSESGGGSSVIDQITGPIKEKLDQIKQMIDSVVEAVPTDPNSPDFDSECDYVVETCLASTEEGGLSFSKRALQVGFKLLANEGRLTEVQLAGLNAAIQRAPAPAYPKYDIPEFVAQIILKDATGEQVVAELEKAKLPVAAMKPVLDVLKAAGAISEQSYADAIAIVESKLPADKPADKPNTDGIKGFISGVIDKVKGALGMGGGAAGDDSANAENGMKEPTGDVAIYSVLGVAAVAGAALVLTRKKKED